MSNLIYYRILGYVVTIVLHGGNMAFLAQPMAKEAMEDDRIKMFVGLKTRFLTGWTVFLQFFVAIVSLICDLLILWNSRKKNYQLPKFLRGFRDSLFCSVVWPSVVVVFSFFWLIFLYDRSLVYPEFLDKILPAASNHIMHTAILPLALWEVFFQPRRLPRSYMKYLRYGLFYFFLYLTVLFYTYYEKGIWIYPILKEFYGTVYLYYLVISMGVYGILCFFLQWFLVYILWSTPEKVTKTAKKIR